jgi:hypothetical protein
VVPILTLLDGDFEKLRQWAVLASSVTNLHLIYTLSASDSDATLPSMM